MLENTDTLLSMAEIAAAFAGFAALVSVLRKRAARPAQATHDLLRLRLVISSSVAGVAGALIPVGMAGYGLDASLIWKLSAVVFLVLDNGIIFSFLGAYRPVRGSFEPDILAVCVVTALEVLEQVSLIAVVLGVLSTNASALYVTALIANLCQAGFIFVRFVGSAFNAEADILPD